MFAVLAEDRSDVESLVVLIRRISGVEQLRVYKKGFSGCGELCRKAWSHIKDFTERGASRFIICHDSDGVDPAVVKKKVLDSITPKTEVPNECCIVVPVQELEAWIIADEEAIRRAIPSLSIKSVPQPESIPSPKEWLVKESRRGRSKPLYDPPTFNAKVAAHLDLQKVQRKCPSFGELVDFVKC